MPYFIGIGGVILFQAAISLALVLATRGGGSFVGLGAMLLALIGIPATALAVGLLIHAHRKNPAMNHIGRLVLFALILPALQLALLLVVSVFHL